MFDKIPINNITLSLVSGVSTMASIVGQIVMGGQTPHDPSGVVTTTAVSLSSQLDKTHYFFYLNIPFWAIIIAMLVLIFFGAMLSAMTENVIGVFSRLKRFVTSIFVGIFISFIIIPMVQEEPNIGGLLLWSFLGSFLGAGLSFMALSVVRDVFTDAKLTNSMSDSVKRILKEKWDALLVLFFGGSK